MTERQFLRILCVGAGAGLVPPLDACAQPTRSLPGTSATDDAGATGAASSQFRRFVAGFRVGEALGSGRRASIGGGPKHRHVRRPLGSRIDRPP